MRTSEPKTLTYTDHDGDRCTIEGCRLTVDELGRHWIWSDQLEQNIVYKTKGMDNALLAAIDSLLFTIQLRDERITGLQRIADLALQFAAAVNPDDDGE